MNKSTVVLLVLVFLFLYLFNCMTPMFFGDDYVYSFIWEGHSLFQPLTEKAARVSCWKDLLQSQYLHYMTWSGRIVNHTIAQLCLWMGKSLFNFLNSLVAILLVLEIYCCVHKGLIDKKICTSMLCWISFAVWAFVPAFGTVFFWLDSTCNYLWPFVIVIGFLIPYISKYYSFSTKHSNGKYMNIGMFFYGVAAGCTNENTICWLILALVLFVYKNRNTDGFEYWLYYGLGGLITGYALLMLAPGNLARLYAEQQRFEWLTKESMGQQFSRLLFVMCYFQLFLWYFILRSLYILHNYNHNRKKAALLSKDIDLVKTISVLSFSMTAVMVFSPGFPFRSAFPGTICLIVAASILLRMQTEYGIVFIQKETKKFIACMSLLYFCMTAFISFHFYYNMHFYYENIITSAKQMKNKNEILVIDVSPPKSSLREQVMSGYHIFNLKISNDERDWQNVSFARYYGIKGIRVTEYD